MEHLSTTAYFGYIDIIDDYQVRGWVVDAKTPNRICSVLVLTSKHRVIRVHSTQHRADVADLFGTSGMCGFFFRLESKFFFSEKIVSVLFLDGTPIEPFLLAAPIWFSPSEIKFFMHIQKTAGTSIRNIIDSSIGSDNIVYVYPDPPGIQESEISKLSYEQMRQFKLIFGHFCYGLHSRFPAPYEYYTIIRSPSSRLRSQIYQLMTWTKLSAQSILEIQISENRFTELDNYYVRSFSGINGPDPIFDNMDNFHLAKRNALEDFKSICVLEHDHIDKWLSKNFKIKDCQVFQQNISIYEEDPLNYPVLFNQLLIRNHNDQLLYDCILKERLA